MVTASPSFQLVGGAACLDFVNSVDRMLHKPWVENLTGYADLCAWSEQSGTLPRAQARALARRADEKPARAVLARAHALREACYRLFLALAEDRAPASADLAVLNAELGAALAHLCLQPAEGGFAFGWERSAEALDAPLWPVARSAAELLTSPERAHVKRCGSETCLWLFLDQTKNHQRRWCDMKVCGNRAKVRAHRARAARKQRRKGS